MENYDINIIGDRIYELRNENNWSQEELANKLMIDKQKIVRYETHHSIPEADMIVMLSKIFNTSTDYLIGVTEKRKKFPKK